MAFHSFVSTTADARWTMYSTHFCFNLSAEWMSAKMSVLTQLSTVSCLVRTSSQINFKSLTSYLSAAARSCWAIWSTLDVSPVLMKCSSLFKDVAVDVRHVHPTGVALAHSGPEHGGEDGTSGRQQNFVSRKLTAANGERDVAVRPAGHVLPQIIGHLQFGSFGQLFAFRFADIFHLTADRQSVVG